MWASVETYKVKIEPTWRGQDSWNLPRLNASHGNTMIECLWLRFNRVESFLTISWLSCWATVCTSSWKSLKLATAEVYKKAVDKLDWVEHRDPVENTLRTSDYKNSKYLKGIQLTKVAHGVLSNSSLDLVPSAEPSTPILTPLWDQYLKGTFSFSFQ